MPTATLTILLAILAQAGGPSNDTPQNNATTFLQQRSVPANRPTSAIQPRIYRGRADGSIEMLDDEGRVLEVYPKGYFMLRMPSVESLRQLESARQTERDHAQQSRERIEQRKLDKKSAAEGAAQARKDAQVEREEAAANAEREASAVRLLDRSTGQYVRAIPSIGSAPASGAEGAKPIRLWDARRHRYVQGVPLESSPK